MFIDKIIQTIKDVKKEFELISKVTSIVAEYLGAQKVNLLFRDNVSIDKIDNKDSIFPIELDEENRIKSAWHIIGAPAQMTGEQKSSLQIVGYLLIYALENIVLRQQTIIDPLTQLYNRTYFDIRLRKEIEGAKRYNAPFSLLMIDIDHFKSFNDSFGHQAGDEVLRIVGGILKHNTRLSDVAFRYGGEEFSVFLPNMMEQNALKVAERLKHHINATINAADKLRNAVKENPYIRNGKPIPISFSIGISAFSGANKDFTIEELIKKADESLYRAKELGRDRMEVVGRNETLKILIVDDETEYTSFLGEYFATRGYKATTANSGTDALKLLGNQEFDVMLLDIRMPGITGLNVLHRIPHLVKKMRVIILTAIGDEEVKKVIYEYGACEFLQKPISIEYLNKNVMARILEMRA